MSERLCSKCGKQLHHLVKGAECRRCREGANGKQRAGGARKKHHAKPSGKPNGALVLTVPATDALCNERWEELGLEQKVHALNSLSE